jgi:hypothetical protein
MREIIPDVRIGSIIPGYADSVYPGQELIWGEKMPPSKTLPDFQKYLVFHKLVREKNVTFYAYWAFRYLQFSKNIKNIDVKDAIRLFVENLQAQDHIADWQMRPRGPVCL